MFGRSGGKDSKPELASAVRYFFAFAEFCLDNVDGQNKVSVDVPKASQFREQFLRLPGRQDLGLSKMSRIEAEAISFTQHHLNQKKTFLIGAVMMSGEPNMQLPLAKEVSTYLGKII
ncbi:MAG: hypothetical protein R3C46_08315 [Hyphomonadaceae bacterium]